MEPQTGRQQHYQGGHYHVSERTQRLETLGLNDPSPDETFDRFAHLAASMTRAPIAMVNFVNDERQMFRGLFVPTMDQHADGGSWTDRAVVFDLPEPSREMSLNHGFCPHVVATRSPLALHDVLAYPRFAGNPVVDELGVRAYIGAPLVDDTNTVIGTVCALDRRPRDRDEWEGRRHDMQRLADALLSDLRLRELLNRARTMLPQPVPGTHDHPPRPGW